jgi:ferredoxin-NADP reductase
VEGGAVSPWLHSLRAGDDLRIRGPFGQCFYTSDAAERHLLLIGVGTGLAPLLGIARAALDAGHAAPIALVHGGLEPRRLYLREELRDLARAHANLEVHACVLRDAGPAELEGPLHEVALGLAGPLDATRVFLCGDANLVRGLQRHCFLAGVPSGEIFADPFLPTPSASVVR